jgi:hypothetical protein
MGKYLKQCIALVVVVSLVSIVASPSAFAQSPSQEDELKAGKMVVDVLVVRPLGLVAMAAGTAVFVVALPFSALGRNVKASAKKLVVEPAKFTFARPLGEF